MLNNKIKSAQQNGVLVIVANVYCVDALPSPIIINSFISNWTSCKQITIPSHLQSLVVEKEKKNMNLRVKHGFARHTYIFSLENNTKYIFRNDNLMSHENALTNRTASNKRACLLPCVGKHKLIIIVIIKSNSRRTKDEKNKNEIKWIVYTANVNHFDYY